jgi:dTDP-4-amino-4,6-dideoxygalactose transaminase
VIVPSNTYIATWLAASLAGATPVPAEPDPATRNLSTAAVRAAITPRTRAVIAVHLYGEPADTDALAAVAREHGIKLIEDAAQAHGARRGGRAAGSLADAAAFSFYPGKNLGAFGDAGAVTTDDEDLAGRVRVLRNYGSSKKYQHDVQGTNSRLDPLQAAFLAVKLSRLDEWNTRRREIAALYVAGLSGIDGLTLPVNDARTQSAWHLFVVQHPRRDVLAARLADAGIETLIHYPVPPHLSGAYAERVGAAGRFPVAEALANTVLSLPIGPHLDRAAADAVVAGVRACAAQL